MNKTIFPNAPETAMTYAPAYVGGPFLGGFLAAFFHKVIHERALDSAEKTKDSEYGQMIQ